MLLNCCLEECKNYAHMKCHECEENFCSGHLQKHLVCNPDHFIETIFTEIEPSMIPELNSYFSNLEISLNDLKKLLKIELSSIQHSINSHFCILFSQCEALLQQLNNEKKTLEKAFKVSTEIFQDILSKNSFVYTFDFNFFTDFTKKLTSIGLVKEICEVKDIDSPPIIAINEEKKESCAKSLKAISEITGKLSNNTLKTTQILSKEIQELDYEKYFVNVTPYEVSEIAGVSINYYQSQIENETYIRKKEFKFKGKFVNNPMITKEIETLRFLSEFSNSKTIFCKFYQCKHQEKSITVYTEGSECRLMDTLKYYKSNRQVFSNHLVEEWIFALISSLHFMKQHKLTFPRISLDNFDMKNNSEIKIRNINYCRPDDEYEKLNYSKYNMIKLLEKNNFVENEQEFGDMEANLVFSLGLIIYEIVSLENSHGYNLKCNRNKLWKKIERLERKNWVKELIIKMTCEGTNRFNLDDCMNYLECIASLN